MSSPEQTSGRVRLIKLLRWLRLVVAAALVLLLVLGALAWWRLSRGPVSLDRFAGSIETLVDGEIAPLSLELGGATLVWHGWGGPLEVRAHDAGVLREDGGPLVGVTGAALAVAKAPLLRGAIAPVWLEINDVRATLVRGEDGTIDLGLGDRPPAGESDEGPSLGDLADRWLAPPDPEAPLGRLTAIRVRDASLRLEDHALDLTATADQVDIELNRGEALVEVSIPLTVEIDETTTPLDAAVTYRLDQGTIRARLDAPEVEPSRLARLAPALEALSALDVSVNLHIDVEMSEDLQVEAGAVDLRGDWGRLRGRATFTDGFSTFDARVEIADLEAWRLAGLTPQMDRLRSFRHPLEGEIEVAWEGGTLRSGRFRLAGTEGAHDWGGISGQLRFEAGSAGPIGQTLAGEVEIRGLKPWMLAGVTGLEPLKGVRLPLSARTRFEIDEGEIQTLDLEAESGAGETSVTGAYPEPVPVRRLELVAAARDGLDTLRLDRLMLDLGDAQPTVVAEATRQDGRYNVRLSASLEQMDIDRLNQYWPPARAAKTRRWIAAHIAAGTARDVVFEAGLDIDPEGEPRVQNLVMSGSMAFDGLSLDVLAPKPPGEGIAGTATFEDGILAFDITEGALGSFQVEGADVTISGLESRAAPKHLSVDLTARHDVETARELLSGEPLDVLRTDRYDRASAQVRTRLQLGKPLSGPERRLEWEARAELTDASWPDAPLGFHATGGAFTVEVSPRAFAFRGTTQANGLPVEIEHHQDLAGGDPALVMDVRTRVDEGGLLALGLPEQPYLSGTTGLHVRYTRGADDLADVSAEVDLGDSRLEIAQLDWTKPVGQEGSVTVAARQQSDRAWRVERVEIAAADLRASGSVEFLRKPFQLERLDVPRLGLPDNEIRVHLHRTEGGVYRLRVSGDRYNLQPPLERLRRGRARQADLEGEGLEPMPAPALEGAPPDEGGGLPPLAFEVRFGQLFLSPEARLDGFEASGAYDGDHWTRAAASATVEPEGAVSLTYGPAVDGYRLEGRADSAGEVLAALTGFGKATGGTVVIEATGPSEAGPFEGRMETKNVFVTENIVLTRMLSLASLDGFVDNLTESSLKIRRGKVDFTLDDSILELKHGRVDYSGFRVSLGGTVDFPRRQVAGHAAVAPLGRLQRLLGKIPILGRLFTGWNREGLFATHARIQGPLNDVEVTHVPLSTLTPGILRDVLGMSGDPEIDDSPENRDPGDLE